MFNIILGAFGALLTGIAIGVQSTLTSRAGALIGDVRTGLLTNLLGGIMAGLLVLVLIFTGGTRAWRMPGAAIVLVTISGFLGILIITGISFSLQRAGILAGLATVILGQLVVSIVVDTLGVGGAAQIPLTSQRVIGILVIVLGVYLVLPRN